MEVYTDGRPTEIRYMIVDRLGNRKTYRETISLSTNFEAEYKSIVGALLYLQTVLQFSGNVVVYNDNAIVVEQLTGQAQVREQRLAELYETVKMLESGFDSVTYNWIPRERNIAGR